MGPNQMAVTSLCSMIHWLNFHILWQSLHLFHSCYTVTNTKVLNNSKSKVGLSSKCHFRHISGKKKWVIYALCLKKEVEAWHLKIEKTNKKSGKLFFVFFCFLQFNVLFFLKNPQGLYSFFNYPLLKWFAVIQIPWRSL